MKRFVLIGLAALFAFQGVVAQEEMESLLRKMEKTDSSRLYRIDDGSGVHTQMVKVSDSLIIINNDTLKNVSGDTVILRNDSTDKLDVIVSDDADDFEINDTAIIRLGRKRIVIIKDDNKTIYEFPDNDPDYESDFEYVERRGFSGHWSGFEIGINGFMDANRSMVMKDDLAWLDLKQGRSWNINVNFMQYSLGLISDKVGLVTGMGVEFNDYHFGNPISLMKNDQGVIVPDSSYLKAGYRVDKTKLSIVNLTVPLLLEFQIPTGDRYHRIYFSGGIICGINVGSHTKVVYNNNGKQKDKNRGDFNIATLRYGLTARIGYRGLRLFANYYPTSLFEDGKGPEVYPFAVGLVLLDF